jgi:hypothetical protein
MAIALSVPSCAEQRPGRERFCYRRLETVARSGLELARGLAKIKHRETLNLLTRSVQYILLLASGEDAYLYNELHL